MITISLTENVPPAFSVVGIRDSDAGRIWGGLKRPDGSWLFPGYFPMGLWVARDLEIAAPYATWSHGAQYHAEQLRKTEGTLLKVHKQYENGEFPDLEVPAGWQWHMEPFKHQRLGIATMRACHRLFLLWEMGTGKTKTAVELFRLQKADNAFKRALVVAPTIVLPTWEREVRRHSNDELTALVIQGERDQQIPVANDYDVVVVSYATAQIEYANAMNNFLPATHRVKGRVTDESVAAALDRLKADDLAIYGAVAKKMRTEQPRSALLGVEYDHIVIDESHMMGNWSSGRTRALLQLAERAQRRYLLTGTPADQPLKLYPQLYALHPRLEGRTYYDFHMAHVTQDANNKHVVLGYSGMQSLNTTVDKVALRMKKSECLDLPPVTFQDLFFSLGPKQLARYNELVEELRATVDPDADPDKKLDVKAILDLPHGAARVTKLLQVSSGFILLPQDETICNECPRMRECLSKGIKPFTKKCSVEPKKVRNELRDFENPKLDLFRKALDHILNDGGGTNKLIAWGTFLPELDDMERVCKEQKIGYVRVDGSNTNQIGAIELVFQSDPKCKVYIGQVQSGVGITLTAANYMLYYSLPWDRVAYRQSLERNNRPGQTRDMTVYRLMGRGTLDEFVSATLAYKDATAFTLTEQIHCAPCKHQARCAKEENRPFSKGCVYQNDVLRLVARPRVIK